MSSRERANARPTSDIKSRACWRLNGGSSPCSSSKRKRRSDSSRLAAAAVTATMKPSRRVQPGAQIRRRMAMFVLCVGPGPDRRRPASSETASPRLAQFSGMTLGVGGRRSAGSTRRRLPPYVGCSGEVERRPARDRASTAWRAPVDLPHETHARGGARWRRRPSRRQEKGASFRYSLRAAW